MTDFTVSNFWTQSTQKKEQKMWPGGEKLKTLCVSETTSLAEGLRKKRPNLGWDLLPGHRTMPTDNLMSLSISNGLTEELMSAEASPFTDEASCFDPFNSPTHMFGRTPTNLSFLDDTSPRDVKAATGTGSASTLFMDYASIGLPPKRTQSPMVNRVRSQPMSPAVISPQNKSSPKSFFAEDSSPLHKSPQRNFSEDSSAPNKSSRRSVFAEDPEDVASSPKESGEPSTNNTKPVPSPLTEVNLSSAMLMPPVVSPANVSSAENSAWGGSSPEVSPANSSKPRLAFNAALGQGASLILSMPGEDGKESSFALDLANPVHTQIVMELIRRHEPPGKSDCCSTVGKAAEGKPQQAGSAEGPVDGKFPVYESGRCAHSAFWVRLRGKRGHSYFCCTYCGVGWRQPTKAKQKIFEKKQAANGEEELSPEEDGVTQDPDGFDEASNEASEEETQLGLLPADLDL